MTTEYVPPSRDRLVELAAALYELRGGNGGFTARVTPEVVRRVPAVFGTARHAVELGDAAVELFVGGRELVAMTLARSSFESAITAMWLVQSPEGVKGFVGEDFRQRRTLSKTMSEAASTVFREGADRIAHLSEDKVETLAASEAKYFNARCEALDGGKDAYVLYRIMSGMAHPSATLVDYYLDANDDSPTGCDLHYEPKPIGHDSWLFLTVAAMMWANRAIDHLDSDHLHRNRLREIASELGVNDTLKLSWAARAKDITARRERRKGN